MSSRTRSLAIPAYVLACLLLGGSPQGVWGGLVLQLGGIAILCWTALTSRPNPTSQAGRSLALLAGAAVLLVLLQLLPLPPSLWTALPGREPVIGGFAMLGEPLPWLPWSLAPHGTIASGLALIPPLAILAGILRLGAYRPSGLAAAVLAGTLLGMLLGTIQVTTGLGYLYRNVTGGQGAGFFANASYMGTLLLVSLPFLAALYRRAGRRKARGALAGRVALAGGALLLIIVGLALSRSLAAILLAVPVLGASLLIALSRRFSPALLPVAAALGVLSLAASLTLGPVIGSGDNRVSIDSRLEIYRTTAAAAAEFMPVGAGLGSFASVYARQEEADAVAREYVNHAHNEVLEIALELGVPGLLLLAALLAWWTVRCHAIWRSASANLFARAATVASAAIMLHNLVDFPIRITAIAACFALCLALMAEPRPRRAGVEHGIRSRPARHLTID